MGFSSFPNYSDNSSNWQQHQPITTTVGFTGNNNINQQFLSPQPPPPLHGGGGGLIRPGSMAERARQANIPQPETALKCPRCDSTNTKFCYFNNYSLTQPRHFCKSCRRYWTRGGALRTVPVGGGCRRNKRTKNSKSQDNTTSNDQYNHRAMTYNQMGPSSSLSSLLSSYNVGLIPGHDHNQNNNNNNTLGLGSSLSPLKLMSPLDFNDNYSLQYGAASATSYHTGPPLHIGGGSSGGSGGASTLLTGFDQWRFPTTQQHQFPSLGGLENPSSSGLYPFDQNPGYGLVTGSGQYRPKNIFNNLASSSSSSSATATTSVKLEETNQFKQQFWNVQGVSAASNAAAATTSSWSDVSNNFSSSSM